LLVGSQTISRLLSTQYGIYMELFLLFWLFCLVLGMSTFSRRDECGGVTWHCTWSTRRRINIAVPATCKLSSVVECHQTIAPPFALPPFMVVSIGALALLQYAKDILWGNALTALGLVSNTWLLILPTLIYNST